MIQLFMGTQEIILLLFSLVIPIGITVLVLFVAYHMVDRWVNKSIDARRKQNELLAKLIDNLGKKGSNY